MEIVKYKTIYYKQVNDIYEKSFPTQEKCANFKKIIENKNTELYCLVDNKTVVGMTYLIQYKDMIFILYLAINPEYRSKGYGSYLLKWCLNKYRNKKFFLNIEEVNEKFDDYEIRKRRLAFYLKNGFFITNYISNEKIINFNILSNCPEIDVEEYKILDKVVAEILEEPVSNIVEIV